MQFIGSGKVIEGYGSYFFKKKRNRKYFKRFILKKNLTIKYLNMNKKTLGNTFFFFFSIVR